MFTVQTPYFMALTACKMVLRAASEDLQHLLLCASEYDQSPFCFFLFFTFFPPPFFKRGSAVQSGNKEKIWISTEVTRVACTEQHHKRVISHS